MVRTSIALWCRTVSLRAKCGVLLTARSSSTHTRVSRPLSAPTVMCGARYGATAARRTAFSRSAVPVRRTHARAQRQVMPILDEHRHLIGQLRLTPVRFALTECLGRRSTRVSCAAWNRRSLAACPDLSVLNTSPAITGAIAGAILACNGARQVLPQVVSIARCSCTAGLVHHVL